MRAVSAHLLPSKVDRQTHAVTQSLLITVHLETGIDGASAILCVSKPIATTSEAELRRTPRSHGLIRIADRILLVVPQYSLTMSGFLYSPWQRTYSILCELRLQLRPRMRAENARCSVHAVSDAVNEAEVGNAKQGKVFVSVDRLMVMMNRLAGRPVSSRRRRPERWTHYEREPKVPLIESTISETLVAKVAESC